MTTKEKAIEEMTKQLSIKSCKAITMDEISQNIGISKKTLYENFSDKAQLIEESLIYYMNNIVKDIKKEITKAENSLDAILKVIYIKAEYSNRIGFNEMCEIKKFYPAVYNKVCALQDKKKNGNNFKIHLDAAIKDGFIVNDLNLEFVKNLTDLNIYNAMTRDFLEKNSFYTPNAIAFAIILILIRGISTLKGVKFIDKFISEIRDFSYIKMNKQ